MNQYILFIISLASLLSCSEVPVEVQSTLELAGKNRKELEKVIHHYQTSGDSLKLKAAYFLIANIANKYSLTGDILKEYNVIFDEIEKIRIKKVFDYEDRIDDKFYEVDSLWKSIVSRSGNVHPSQLEKLPDVHHITSDFLIENIEYAFKAWEFPWCRHLDFDAFCEYILPYRFLDEELTSWRPFVYHKYLPFLDSLQHINDPVIICDTINKRLSHSWKYSHVVANYPVAMTMQNMAKGNMGSCTHQAGLGIFVMRALGIPVVHEEVPHYGNRSLGHEFNAVLGKDGKFLDFEVGDPNIGNVVVTRNNWNFLMPKIYRKKFSINKEFLEKMETSQEEFPPYFRQVNLEDITSLYLPTRDVVIEITEDIPQGSNHVYLCVFDNKSWKAVCNAKIKNAKATFKDMGLGIVYMPMFYHNGSYHPAADPIILHKDEKRESITPSIRNQTLILNRKYTEKKYYNWIMAKGKFQAANNPDFHDAITLYVVDTLDAPVNQTVNISPPRKYRFVRYLFPDNSKGNIAEMAFYSKENTELKGEIITSTNIKNTKIVKKAFDKDPLTNIHIKVDTTDKMWVGLDFGSRKAIKKISYCPRTDKNNVWKGLRYKLYYWDKGWKSLGMKKAEEYHLKYEVNVSNALFLLRCLDEGVEERIFTYENGKQVWW